jgi:energy-coupling factor transport system substrate-specific component
MAGITGAAGLLGPFRVRLNTLAIVLIPVCVAINWAGHAIVSTLKLPLFMDSIGSILGGLLAGPWVGGIAGLLSNFVSAGTVDPTAALYSIVSFGIGVAAGIGGYLALHRTLLRRLVLYLLVFVTAAGISTVINMALYGGQSGSPVGDAALVGLVHLGVPLWFASFLDEGMSDAPDKLLTVLIATYVYAGLPRRFRALFQLYRWRGRT